MPKKCCVPSCGARKDEAFLHSFPRNYEKQRLWLKILDIRQYDNLSSAQLRARRICDKHFEDSFKKERNPPRLPCGAYPTLFTAEEIYTGVPEKTYKFIEPPCKTDHTYTKSKDFLCDHTYCEVGYKTSVEIKDKSQIAQEAAAAAVGDLGALGKDADTADADAGNDDGCDNDDDVPNPPVPEEPQAVFSWEKSDAIIADDPDELTCVTVQDSPGRLSLDIGDVSMYHDEPLTSTNGIDGECTEYVCNECGVSIKGFRYICVQCVDWDLCAACEARAAHAAHYVLRVPRPRPYKEIQAVLSAIRHQMLSENLFLPGTIQRIKEELKDESEEEAEVPEPPPEPAPDPLAAWDVGFHHDIYDILQDIPEQIVEDEDNPPHRKRRRSCLDPLADTEYDTPYDDLSFDDLITIHPRKKTEVTTDHITLDNDNSSNDSSSDSDPIEIIDVDKFIKTNDNTGPRKIEIINKPFHYKDDRNPFADYEYHHDSDIPVGRCVTLCNKKLTVASRNSKDVSLKSVAANSTLKSPCKNPYPQLVKFNNGLNREGIGNTGDNKKPLKPLCVRLPTGVDRALLVKMLQSKATVRLEDVIRKKKVRKKTEINEI